MYGTRWRWAALSGVDAVCHQAAMVGLGKGFADASAYVGCNDLGTAMLLEQMAEAGVHRLGLAGSMVVYGEGRYNCPLHGGVRPGPRAVPDLDAGRFEPPLPRLRCGADPATGRRGRPGRPAQCLRHHETRAGVSGCRVGAGHRRSGCRSATTTSTGRHAAGHPVRGGGLVLPLGAGAG